MLSGCGIRKTGCLEGVSKDTVFRLDKIAGAHAKVLHDELVRELALDEVQFDEKGSFVGKKEKRFSKGEKARVDPWDHVSFASKKKLVVSMLRANGQRRTQRG